MNSTTDLSEIQKCNYLNANLQSAEDMILNCIGDPSKGKDKFCKSDYKKLYDPITSNLENIAIKRGVSAGYGIDQIIEKKTPTPTISNKNIPEQTIEGFTSNIFITDNGPGESVITNKCPQGYKWCNKTGACVQVCIGCKYRDRMKSQIFNEADPCFPEGVYNGVDNRGYLKCTCGSNNQYCSDNFIADIFTANGDLLIGSRIKNIGNFLGLNNLFNIQNL